MGSTFKGKNLLLLEQILSFKSRSHIEKGAKNEYGRVASRESGPFHLNEKFSLWQVCSRAPGYVDYSGSSLHAGKYYSLY